MLVLTLLCRWHPEILIGFLTRDAAVIDAGANFLHIMAWNILVTGLIFTFGGIVQSALNAWLLARTMRRKLPPQASSRDAIQS